MRLVLTVLAAALFAVAPALAQSEEDVHRQIEELLGNANGFAVVFDELQWAMIEGDAAAVADLAVYPLVVRANGEEYDILEPQDLVDNFDSLVMPETREAVSNQDYDDLFVNSDGVMIGDGEVWIAPVCEDDACEATYWGVTVINN